MRRQTPATGPACSPRSRTNFSPRSPARDLGVDLPEPGRYGAGVVFLPTDEAERNQCKANRSSKSSKSKGKSASAGGSSRPTAKQRTSAPPPAPASRRWSNSSSKPATGLDQDALERQLYIILKRSSRELREKSNLKQALMFYYCSLSTKVIIYKGMLTPDQVMPYFKDLQDPRL